MSNIETSEPSHVCDCNPWCGLPPCDECGEDHGSIELNGRRLCRDCNVAEFIDGMKCSACQRMRYRTDATGVLGSLGECLWGDRCVCEPLPPTVLQLRKL